MVENLSNQAAQDLMLSHYVGHLGVADSNGQPYVIPVTYLYDKDTNSIIGYTAMGRKVETLRANPKVSLAITEMDSLKEWKSVVIEGTYEELNGMDAMNALQLLLTELRDLINDDGQNQVEYIKDMARTKPNHPKVIYRIHINKLTGRFEQSH